MNKPRVHFGLGGRVVVITGAAQGIGEACARRLVPTALPWRFGTWPTPPARRSRQTCRPQARKPCTATATWPHKAEVDAALAATLAHFGHVDGLVNNAGIFKAAAFLDITEADWDAVIAVNLKGSFLVGQAVARAMLATQRRRGAIVNMSSVNGTLAIPSIASYNASKGGINQLTRVMALAWPSTASASTPWRRAPSPPSWRAAPC
jgi:NAD(P)-dependent dehydrogenase (short-subunit alcohol dehydrogenase family)